MNIQDKHIHGNGNKFILVVTYDEAEDLGFALQDVIEDLGTGKRKAEEATDTYFYGFEINGGK
jgi:hypothetical protein